LVRVIRKELGLPNGVKGLHMDVHQAPAKVVLKCGRARFCGLSEQQLGTTAASA